VQHFIHYRDRLEIEDEIATELQHPFLTGIRFNWHDPCDGCPPSHVTVQTSYERFPTNYPDTSSLEAISKKRYLQIDWHYCQDEDYSHRYWDGEESFDPF